MKFDDLKFDHFGCCDTDSPWAEVRHENGLRTDVYDNKNGTYKAVTFNGGTLWVGAQELADGAAVEARLAADAAMSL